MRKLSSISGSEGIVIVGKIIPLLRNAIRKTGKTTKDPYEYFGQILESAPDEIIEIISIIDNQPIEVYQQKNIIEIMQDVNDMIKDADLMRLFGSQMQKKTSSTSAWESSEVKK